MKASVYAGFLVIAVFAGCATTTPELVSRGSDPLEPHAERCLALHDALSQRDPGVAQDLTFRAELLLAASGAAPEVAKNRDCAIDIIDALVRDGEKSAPPLAIRLADRESPFLSSRPALEHLTRHPAATVRDLARAQLRRLER